MDKATTFEQALLSLLQEGRPVNEVETIATITATGRVLAKPQVSPINVPSWKTSAMDGYAVSCKDIAENKTRLHVAQRIAAGQLGQPLERETAARIFTGAPVPDGADAVVMQELCEQQDEFVVIKHQAKTGEWVRPIGEDIKKGAQILPKGARLRPQDISIIASAGIANVPVYRKLKVAAFFAGNELVMPGDTLPPGAIYNSNRFTVNGLLQNLGCEVEDFGIVPDTLIATRNALRQAAKGHDLILTSAGVSVGEEDHVKPAVEAEGILKIWKVIVKPGRPTAFGKIGSTYFLGLPGNPVSNLVAFMLFVRPFILRCQGVQNVNPKTYLARADFDLPNPDERHEFLRVKFNGKGGLDLFPNQSSSILTSTVWADGLLDNPSGKKITRGDMVKFIPFTELLN